MAGYEPKHCVHGEWMTLKEVCAALGITRDALRKWRQKHRRADGKQALVEEAWDYYTARAAGVIPSTWGRTAAKYPYHGHLATIPEVAERTGIDEKRIRNRMNYYHCRLDTAVKKIMEEDRRKEIDRATESIMEIIFQ